MTDTLLEVQDLTVDFHTHGGTVEAVRGVSFSVVRIFFRSDSFRSSSMISTALASPQSGSATTNSSPP